MDYVFGYPGGSVLHIYDALFKQDQVKHILVRHEQAAVHAADAYSRSSNRIGVAMVTSGPGVTNAVTGIATAYMDSIPIVVLVRPGADGERRAGRVPGVRHGRDHASVREAQLPGQGRQGPGGHDQEGVPHRVHRPARARWWWTSPRTSPRRSPSSTIPPTIRMRSYNPVIKGHPGQIKKAVRLLSEAKRPMIYVGGGVILSDASEPLTELARRLGFAGHDHADGPRGVSRHRPAVGRACSACTARYEANMAMQHADVILAVGARFDDRVIGNPEHFAEEEPQGHPRRHRSLVDLQARAGGRAHRRQPARRAGRDAQADRRASSRPSRRWPTGGSRSTSGAAATACVTGRTSGSCRSTCSRSSTR